MHLTFRWYADADPIALRNIRQIPGMRGIASALYDLQNDPAELQDRIASEPAVAERIFEEFRRRQIPVETVAELPASLDPETARRLESLGYVGD